MRSVMAIEGWVVVIIMAVVVAVMPYFEIALIPSKLSFGEASELPKVLVCCSTATECPGKVCLQHMGFACSMSGVLKVAAGRQVCSRPRAACLGQQAPHVRLDPCRLCCSD